MTLLGTLERTLALASVAAFAACTDSDSSDFENAIVNVGLASRATALAGEGDVWLFAVRESESGGVDLNGDGDDFDAVLFVQDLASGTVRNTGLALDGANPPVGLTVKGDLVAFPASETASGNRDQNGDGDAGDLVMQVHDAKTGTTRSLGVAVSAVAGVPVIGDGLIAFAVNEAAQGQDLDGDPRTASDVLHLYDPATRELVNTRLVVSGRLFLAGRSVGFLEEESTVDRNGDGDTLDRVLRLFDVDSETVIETKLASDGSEPLFAAGVWLVAVPEIDQGGLDLDGDGQVNDVVFEVFDPRDGSVTNLELASFAPEGASSLTLDGGGQLFALFAVDAAGLPRLFFYLPAGPFLVPTDLVTSRPVAAGNFVGFLAIESLGGEDLDDDGDQEDFVAFLLDPRTLHVVNLRLDALAAFGSEKFLLLARFEGTANIDWNEDGDQDDVVVQLFDPFSGQTINTAVASVDVFGANQRETLLYASEISEGIDLNVDGDLEDEVFVLFDNATEELRSLGVAGSSGFDRFAGLGRSGAVFLADEKAQEADLNGDGDRADAVWHRTR